MNRHVDETEESERHPETLALIEDPQQPPMKIRHSNLKSPNSPKPKPANPMPDNKMKTSRFQVGIPPTDQFDGNNFCLTDGLERRHQMHFSDSELHLLRRQVEVLPAPISPPQSHASRSASSCQLSVWHEDFCQLCTRSHHTRQRQTRAEQEQEALEMLNEPPPPTKRLPCSCEDRRLHLACLETKFLDEAVYAGNAYGYGNVRSGGGGRQLSLRCASCGDAFIVTRRRGRRSCDAAARTSFCRHLLATLIVSGLLIGFGLGSMFHPQGGRVNIVNAILLGSGTLLAIVFALYELWLLHRRYEFVFTRMRTPASVTLRLSWSNQRRGGCWQLVRTKRRARKLARQQSV